MPTSAGIFLTTAREDYLNNPDGSDTNWYGVPPNDSLLPMSFACPKAFEGQRWWNTPAGFDALRKNYIDQNIGVLGWGIPQGRTAAGAYQEGLAAAQILQHLGGFMQVDLEFDPASDDPYWNGDEAAVDQWGHGVADGGGGEMVLLPDSRADKLGPMQFWYWYSRPWISRRVHPQAYASIFYTPRPGRQKRGIDAATKPLLDGGILPEHLFPVLSTSDNDGLNPISGGELVEGIMYCHEQGFGGFFIWRRGYATPEQFAAMQTLDDPWAPPVPPSGSSEWEEALARMNAASIAQRTTVEEVLRLAPGAGK